MAVGVVDPTKFDWEKQNLGASTSSWCYSKTGKRGDGKAFVEYGRTYSAGACLRIAAHRCTRLPVLCRSCVTVALAVSSMALQATS